MVNYTLLDDVPARLLAMVLAAGAGADPQVAERLATHEAHACIGVSPDRFAELLAACDESLGAGLCNRSWLDEQQQAQIGQLADHVDDASLRLQLCRLASELIGREDGVAQQRHLVLDHLLSRWHIDRAQLAPSALP